MTSTCRQCNNLQRLGNLYLCGDPGDGDITQLDCTCSEFTQRVGREEELPEDLVEQLRTRVAELEAQLESSKIVPSAADRVTPDVFIRLTTDSQKQCLINKQMVVDVWPSQNKPMVVRVALITGEELEVKGNLDWIEERLKK